MNSLFSHAANNVPEPGPDGGLETLVASVTVPGPVSRAFEGFTDHTHLWWPMASHSVYGEGSYVEFEEQLILETADDGRTSIWGTVGDWQPPFTFQASWHPGSTALWSTEIRVVFVRGEDSTTVEVRHDGWEGAENPVAVRNQWAQAWPEILGSFARFMGAG
ncbi:SRPBCC domain-containing protein [Pseudarthrobacter sp. J64]|uniref:SRPBCC domain-containing protein n=1 Tax=Pseudarthrobacter sp. J64 TaxID=3116485 RepID=UPI002E81AA30|nr:SRPBCC domain-containing protein [Pseudarthrobacter sp. J64]MEE2569897.1 SRPBCC domain-containing protein [Pseudarthrobacter sp. J64]